MKKSIPFEVFGENQYLYFDIQRLMRLEQLLGKSISNVVASQDITIDFVIKSLMVGLAHHNRDNVSQWTAKVEKYFEDGGSIELLAEPILRAVIASGIFGKLDAEGEADEKNVQAPAE